MTNFNITADNFAWITGAADDPEDKCLHGHVTVTIGGKTFEANGTVSAIIDAVKPCALRR